MVFPLCRGIEGVWFPPLVHIVIDALADLLGELLSKENKLAPGGRGEGRELAWRDALVQQSVQETGIEVVAGTDGAHGLDRGNRYLQSEVGCEDPDGAVAVGADEVGAERTDVSLVDFRGVGGAKEVPEILGAATDDAAPTAILLEVLQRVGDVGDVRLAEVDVVIKQGARLVSLLQQPTGVWSQDRIDGKE